MTIKGTIESIRYRNEANDWTVASMRVENKEKEKDDYISVTGILSGIRVGMTITITGELETNKYGPTLRVSSWSESRPSDIDGIEKYLASGLIKNIGPAYAKMIVTAFGENALEVIDNNPERLAEIKGIGKKRIASIIEAAREQKDIRNIMIWLKRNDIPNGLAAKIYQKYGGDAIAMLEEDPYRLCDELNGVGFKKADGVAMNLGIEPTEPIRLRSGVQAVLKDAAAEGHTCLELGRLIERAAGKDYLNVETKHIETTLDDPLCNILIENNLAYLYWLLNCESKIAKKISTLARKGKMATIASLTEESISTIDFVEKETGITYSNEQADAILTATQNNLLILTGGPGTGKTATTNAIIRILEKNGATVRLAAPTGRAAKRMAEVTGRPSMTIHRLLEYSQGEFQRKEDFPLDGDAFIIDEASMIDTQLMCSLLSAIPDDKKLILVGDADQLPSVGPGCVLRDLIETLPGRCTTRLTKIYRQAQQSHIVLNAHHINKGQHIQLTALPNDDFLFLASDTPEQIHDYVTDLVTNQIPRIDGYKSDEIQVLTPMRRDWDPIASTALNRELQRALNPDGEQVAAKGDSKLCVGDRIMQTKNNYDKDVYNGDIGVITRKITEQRDDNAIFEAEIDGRTIPYAAKDLDEVELAYACTIHKSQGSEYPAVVIPVHDSQYIMLRRNLLYTAVTRAKKLCILVGTSSAVRTAISRQDTAVRCTGLRYKILNELKTKNKNEQ